MCPETLLSPPVIRICPCNDPERILAEAAYWRGWTRGLIAVKGSGPLPACPPPPPPDGFLCVIPPEPPPAQPTSRTTKASTLASERKTPRRIRIKPPKMSWIILSGNTQAGRGRLGKKISQAAA